MPVDEFGREIPGVSSSYVRESPPPSPRPSRRYSSGDHRDDRDRDDEYRRHHRSSKRRRERSPTPPPRRRKHPSERYVKDPMLCEYVWKDKKGGKDDDDKKPKSYDDYRREYCLNYVRSFFNEHMDDSWFRKTYSPLEKKRAVLEERERASQEAAAFRKQVTQDPETFCEQARLGGGVKETTPPPSRKRKYSEADAYNTVPKSHVLSTDDRTLAIHDIPPHVTDEQLLQALLDHCAADPSSIQIFSSSVNPTSKLPLVRSAHAMLESAQVRQDVLANLAYHHPRDGSHVPRKDDNTLPKELDLEVDCSDPYGRVDVDQDGRGGGDDGRTVPHRKAVVIVSTSPEKTPTSVLSAAVSSKDRIARDKDAAIMLSRALDVARSIPTESRLDAILELLPSSCSPEDLLDVSIAYLRRVHLFSFYNGCAAADSLGNVLAEKNPASTIHLRLKGADDLLKEEEDDESKTTDLLVKRLDDSISKALEESNEWVAHAGIHVLNPELDAQAAELEEAEEQARYDWLENHGIVDEAGRGRCSFHFCRKLFKDDNFLKKHLLKKHGEFLKAEMAKCHDKIMMKAWDNEENRPVPPILVDCGANFGFLSSPVTGVEPTAQDPEPELWRKEEEKRKRMEEEAERRRGPPPPPVEPPSRRDDSGAGDSGEQPSRPNRGSNFVDVDDMKEEKVELSFENVEVVAPPPKKKRKKKKLL